METVGTKLHIYSQYNKDLIEELKVMGGAKWNPDNKCWIIDDSERNRYAFEYLLGFRVCPDKFEPIPYTSNRRLFDHQREGVRFAIENKRCMLAFEMGLGKTLTAIEIMEYAFLKEKLYNWWLVAPFGAQKEWKRQLSRWGCKLKFVVVTTYESLQKHMEAAGDEHVPHGVIFDESVKLKNPSAKRSQVAAELCRIIRSNPGVPNGGYIIELSGAPAPKNPIDWWHQIECLQPGFIREGDPYKFRNRYANIITVDHGYGPHKEVDSWNEEEVEKLGKRLSPIVMVKKKKDCLNLPDKIFDTLTVEPSVDVLCTAELIMDTCGTGALALERLRELSDGFLYRGNFENNAEPDEYDGITPYENSGSVENDNTTSRYTIHNTAKLGVIRELLDFYHTNNGGPGRLVIYAAYQASIDLLVNEINKTQLEETSDGYWRAARIDGRGWSDPDILNSFESDDPSNIVIVANPACVHGLTLSQTLCLVYYSNSFHVDHRIQSLDRRDRPGMDVTKGTRIVDIVHLPSDQYIVDKLNAGTNILNLTLDELRRIYNGKSSN